MWERLIKYAKNPLTPSSAGIIAILKGVFSPFAYLPISSLTGRFLTESIESISLFNRGTGIAIGIMSLVSYGLVIKRKIYSSYIIAGISALIVVIEAYWVTVIGVTGKQYGSIYDPTIFLPTGPLVVYNLTVRAKLGSGVGYLLGGHISLLLSIFMAQKQMQLKDISRSYILKRKYKILIGVLFFILLVVVVLTIIYLLNNGPIAKTRIDGFINR